MEKLLIFIKHHLSFLWYFIEKLNDNLFSLIYLKEIKYKLYQVFSLVTNEPFTYRRLNMDDVQLLFDLIKSQKESDLKYFHPHDFDLKSLKKQFKKKSFLMMGAFDGGKLVGYFFLRFFINKKCFVGRLTDSDYRGKGVGKIMNKVMYEIAWGTGFRCLSTVSKNNQFVMQAHAKNPSIKVLKQLNNDFMLVEFVRPNK